MQAIPGIMAGEAATREGNFNQAIANRNAVEAERDGSAEVDRVRYAMRQQIGQQLVAQGGSGLEMGTGSAADAIAESQVNGVLDAMTLRRKAKAQGDAYRMQGAYAKMEAGDKSRGAYFGAAAATIKAAADYAAAGG